MIGTITFNNEQMVEMAKFVAQLVRESVRFESESTISGAFVITLTGGY